MAYVALAGTIWQDFNFRISSIKKITFREFKLSTGHICRTLRGSGHNRETNSLQLGAASKITES